MAAMRIDVPDDIRSRIAARAADSGFDSVEAYVEALVVADAIEGPTIRDDQLEPLLLQRIDGPFVEADDADFAQMRKKLSARMDEGSEPRP